MKMRQQNATRNYSKMRHATCNCDTQLQQNATRNMQLRHATCNCDTQLQQNATRNMRLRHATCNCDTQHATATRNYRKMRHATCNCDMQLQENATRNMQLRHATCNCDMQLRREPNQTKFGISRKRYPHERRRFCLTSQNPRESGQVRTKLFARSAGKLRISINSSRSCHQVPPRRVPTTGIYMAYKSTRLDSDRKPAQPRLNSTNHPPYFFIYGDAETHIDAVSCVLRAKSV